MQRGVPLYADIVPEVSFPLDSKTATTLQPLTFQLNIYYLQVENA